MTRRILFGLLWAAALFLTIPFVRPLWYVRVQPGRPVYSPPDLMQFWFAGRLAAEGHIRQLYQPAAYLPLTSELASRGERLGAHPFNRPAFAAWLCVPLARLDYRAALLVAAVVNLALLAWLVWKLPVWFPSLAGYRPCLLAFVPFLLAIGLGQDALLLTLAAGAALAWGLAGREAPAGVLLALCLVKPHLIWALPVALLAGGKRRMLAAFLVTGGVLALVSAAAVGPEGIRDWFRLLQAETTDVLPETMANLRAVGLRWGPAAAGAAGVFVALCFAVVLRERDTAHSLAAAILASLLINLHTYHYDLSLLPLAAGLTASRASRFLLLFPWPFLYGGDGLLAMTGVLLIVLGLEARQAWRGRARGQVSSPAAAGACGDQAAC